MSEEHKVDGTPLYKAACDALASEATAENTFSKMIACAYGHSSLDDFNKEVKATEKDIKKDFSIGSMPGPWRSAKSVITSSMKLGIRLIDDNGNFVGKTFLQNKIKEAKGSIKEPMTHEKYVAKITNLLGNVPDDLDAAKIWKEVKAFLER